MPSDGRRVLLDADSSEMRRRLGATAWVVFEELLLVSTDDGGCCEATTSVRALAARTGLAKDTVARALSRLRRAGLITAQQSRTAGVFAAGSYLLVVPTGITLDERAAAHVDHVRPVVAEPAELVRRSESISFSSHSISKAEAVMPLRSGIVRSNEGQTSARGWAGRGVGSCCG